MSDDKGGHGVMAVTFHPEVIGQELNMLRALKKVWGLGKAPEGAAMSCRQALHKTERENLMSNAAFMSHGKDRRYDLPSGKFCSV